MSELKVFKNKKFVGYMTPTAYINYLGKHPYATCLATFKKENKEYKVFTDKGNVVIKERIKKVGENLK